MERGGLQKVPYALQSILTTNQATPSSKWRVKLSFLKSNGLFLGRATVRREKAEGRHGRTRQVVRRRIQVFSNVCYKLALSSI